MRPFKDIEKVISVEVLVKGWRKIKKNFPDSIRTNDTINNKNERNGSHYKLGKVTIYGHFKWKQVSSWISRDAQW